MKKVIALLFLSYAYIGLAQETYTLSSDSKLTIDGTSTIHDWTVTANSISGIATAEEGFLKTIDFEVSVADLESGRGAVMDKKTHNALKKDDYPKITFVLTEVKSSTNLVGKLNVAGQEKTVGIPVKMKIDNTGIKIEGQYGITLQDYGMEPPTAMFGSIVVGDDVTVIFDLIFSKN